MSGEYGVRKRVFCSPFYESSMPFPVFPFPSRRGRVKGNALQEKRVKDREREGFNALETEKGKAE